MKMLYFHISLYMVVRVQVFAVACSLGVTHYYGPGGEDSHFSSLTFCFSLGTKEKSLCNTCGLLVKKFALKKTYNNL